MTLSVHQYANNKRASVYKRIIMLRTQELVLV